MLYRVLDLGDASTLPLTGDFVQTGTVTNLNGIDTTANGMTLVVVQSTGFLFTVDPLTGVTQRIDLNGETVSNGDGLLLQGRTLYVVRNQLNLVAVIVLSPDLSSGVVTDGITNDDFDVPTTIDRLGNLLYVVNARFSTPPTPDTAYWITGFRRRNGKRNFRPETTGVERRRLIGLPFEHDLTASRDLGA